MEAIVRIGLDTSKSVFQLHGVDGMEQPVLRRKLRRGQVLAFFSHLPPTLVAMEACGASHYWARELQSLGHEVAMIPPQYVKPYVQRGKSDAADAEAICEAASRPKLRKNFVPIKSPEQQGAQMLTRVRNQFIGRRTQLANSIRGYAAEFGFTAPKGLSRLPQLLIDIRADATVPNLAMELIEALAAELMRVNDQIVTLDKKLMQLHRSSEMSRRLATIPGIGPIGATLLSIKVVDARGFKSARNFAAWLGLTPKNHSTAGKNRLGVITRAGDGMLRTVLVAGARCPPGPDSNQILQHSEMTRCATNLHPPLSCVLKLRLPQKQPSISPRLEHAIEHSGFTCADWRGNPARAARSRSDIR